MSLVYPVNVRLEVMMTFLRSFMSNPLEDLARHMTDKCVEGVRPPTL